MDVTCAAIVRVMVMMFRFGAVLRNLELFIVRVCDFACFDRGILGVFCISDRHEQHDKRQT